MRFDVVDAHCDVERPRALSRARAEYMSKLESEPLPMSTVFISDIEAA